LGIGPNPQSPIPNPQSPIPIYYLFHKNNLFLFFIIIKNKKYLIIKIIILKINETSNV